MSGERQPGDTHPNAGRPSGYVPEDLVNRVTEIVSQIQTQLLITKRELMSDIARLEVSRKESHAGLRREVELNQNALVGLLHDIHATAQETARGLGKLAEAQAFLTTRVDALQAGYDTMIGQMSDISERMNEIDDMVVDFRQSRDASIFERQELRAADVALHADMEDSKADRAGMRVSLDSIERLVTELGDVRDERIAALEAWVAAQPSPEETSALIHLLRENQGQLRTLTEDQQRVIRRLFGDEVADAG